TSSSSPTTATSPSCGGKAQPPSDKASCSTSTTQPSTSPATGHPTTSTTSSSPPPTERSRSSPGPDPTPPPPANWHKWKPSNGTTPSAWAPTTPPRTTSNT